MSFIWLEDLACEFVSVTTEGLDEDAFASAS
ncbi:hypothetical protein GGQ84_001351 [Desulfitispora alkaliphila]